MKNRKQPLTELQMLQQTINAMVEQEQRISTLEAQIREIKSQIAKKQCATLGDKKHFKTITIHLKVS